MTDTASIRSTKHTHTHTRCVSWSCLYTNNTIVLYIKNSAESICWHPSHSLLSNTQEHPLSLNLKKKKKKSTVSLSSWATCEHEHCFPISINPYHWAMCEVNFDFQKKKKENPSAEYMKINFQQCRIECPLSSNTYIYYTLLTLLPGTEEKEKEREGGRLSQISKKKEEPQIPRTNKRLKQDPNFQPPPFQSPSSHSPFHSPSTLIRRRRIHTSLRTIRRRQHWRSRCRWVQRV